MLRFVMICGSVCVLSGCVAYTIVDTVVGVTTTAVETTVDVTAGAVDLLIPDADDAGEDED